MTNLLTKGNHVKLEPEIPRNEFMYGVGNVNYDEIGVITDINDDKLVTVDFPQNPAWFGSPAELIRVQPPGQPEIKPGDMVKLADELAGLPPLSGFRENGVYEVERVDGETVALINRDDNVSEEQASIGFTDINKVERVSNSGAERSFTFKPIESINDVKAHDIVRSKGYVFLRKGGLYSVVRVFPLTGRIEVVDDTNAIIKFPVDLFEVLRNH